MRHAGWLFLSFQIFYLLTTSGRLHTVDEYEAFYTTESFALNGDLSLPKERFFFGRRSQDGRYYAPYGPLSSVLAAPGYLAGKAVAGAFRLSHRARENLAWFSTCIVNTTFAALGVAAFFLLALRLGATREGA